MEETYLNCDKNTESKDLKNLKKFDCGIKTLNKYLQDNFLKNVKNGSRKSEVFIDTTTGDVVAFMVTSLSSLQTKETLLEKEKLPREISCLKIWMIAVDLKYQGKGLGKKLMLNAIIDAIKVHEITKCAYVYLDAAPTAVNFYETLGFEKLTEGQPAEGEPIKMVLDIRDYKEEDFN